MREGAAAAIGGGGWGRKQQKQQPTKGKGGENAGSGKRPRFSLPWSSSSKATPAPALQSGSAGGNKWWPPRLPALRRGGNWAVEELEEYEYEEEEEDGSGLMHMLPRGFVSMAARLLAVAAVVLTVAFAPPPSARGGFLGALTSGGAGGGARGFLRRLLGRGDNAKSLPATATEEGGGGAVSPQLPWRAHPRPKLGDPAQLSTVGGCLRALDHHVRAEDAPAVFEALRELTCAGAGVGSQGQEEEGASLSTFMAVEDWLGDWLARRPPPPPDLLPPALDYARALLAAQEEEEAGVEGSTGASSTRGERRGTSLERFLAHRPLSALILGPDALAAYGGPATFLAAARALAAFSRTHGGLRRRLLDAPLGLWARLGREEGQGQCAWEPGAPPRGLRNQGNTCYLNSLLQQLAGVGACREGVLGEEDLVGAMTEEDAARWSEDAAGVQLLEELRRVLGALGEADSVGRHRGVETRRLVEALEVALDWGPAVWEQNDATELLMLLLERLEGGPGAALAACFTGRLQDRIYQGGCGHERRKPQAFVTVPLPVKGMRGLQDALLAWTQGEEVNPSKACKECGAASALRHEETLLDLPPVLAFQLQRFEAAPGSWSGTAKTRGRFAFPETVDLYPYTAEGKARRERDPGMEEDGDGDEEEGPPREWYRLQGVLMHRGSSPQEGHYYSYVRRGGDGAWWCLNDEAVAPFDVAREAERAWFQGGVDSPFILLYARDGGDAEEEEEEYESSSGSGGEEGSVLAAHPAAPARVEALAALVAGLTEATLGGGESHYHASLVVPPTDLQRLLELFHWLAASAAKAASAAAVGLQSGGDEVLHALKAAGNLLRRRLLEEGASPRGGRERDALALWVLRQLAGGWLADVFVAAAPDQQQQQHAAPLLPALRKLWAGVAEAALDRAAAPSSLGGDKAGEAMDALAAALAAPALRARWEADTALGALVERLRPRMGVAAATSDEEGFEDALEELGEEEEQEGRRRGGGGAGREGG